MRYISLYILFLVRTACLAGTSGDALANLAPVVLTVVSFHILPDEFRVILQF